MGGILRVYYYQFFWLQKTKVELQMKASIEQTKEDAEQKLSEKEQEMEKMRQEVSLVLGGLKSMLHPWIQKTGIEQAKEKELDDARQKLSQKEQEIEKMRQEVSLGWGHLNGVLPAFLFVEEEGGAGKE